MKIKNRIPNEQECLSLLKEYDVLPNILEHSKMVRIVSLAVADNLLERSLVNRELISSAALLHDIAKSLSIREELHNHDIVGGRILRERGFIEIALIVESHVVLKDFDPSGRLNETEIVFYADKRVMHDKLVTIDERVDDIIERYSKNSSDEKLIRKNQVIIREVEKKIQKYLMKPIDEVLDNI